MYATVEKIHGQKMKQNQPFMWLHEEGKLL